MVEKEGFYCDYCGKKIDVKKPTNLEHHFCDKECYYGYKRSQKKFCKRCGILIGKPYNDYNKRGYCCKSCFDFDYANTKCAFCGKPFYVRPDTLKKGTKVGFTCSRECSSEIRKQYYLWENNPHYKGKKYSRDGYTALGLLPKIGNVKINNIVMQIVLGINKTPKGYQIHHRDGDVNNNSPENLALLTIKEHAYLHKMMGKIGLITYSRGLIDDCYINNIIDDGGKTLAILGKNFLTQRDSQELIGYQGNTDDMFYNSRTVADSIEEIAIALQEKYGVDVSNFINSIKTNKK